MLIFVLCYRQLDLKALGACSLKSIAGQVDRGFLRHLVRTYISYFQTFKDELFQSFSTLKINHLTTSMSRNIDIFRNVLRTFPLNPNYTYRNRKDD